MGLTTLICRPFWSMLDCNTSSEFDDKMADEKKTEFEELESQTGLIGEFIEFLFDNKKFWMIPILLVLALLGAVIIAGQSALAPFIYSLF